MHCTTGGASDRVGEDGTLFLGHHARPFGLSHRRPLVRDVIEAQDAM